MPRILGPLRAGELQFSSLDASHARSTLGWAPKVALADAWNSPAQKALYFNTPDLSPSVRAIKVASIGNHVFYR